MPQLSLIPTPKDEVDSTPEPPQELQEVTYKSTCKGSTIEIDGKTVPCYDEKTQICPKYGYKIDAKLAARQRLCDIEDTEIKTEAEKD
jgi:hypothetical protein